MGADEGSGRPTGPDAVRVIHTGVAVEWPERGTLRLEDGTTLKVDRRLPLDLPLGYHEFFSETGDTPSRVIITPGQCVLPARPTWGWSAQLYAVRSAESWGIGDLADLRQLGRWSAVLGAGLTMVNPLFAPAPIVPQEPSPYYPSSRRFLNPLYLRIEEVPGASELGTQLQQLAAAGRALNASRRIDRDAVFRLKQQALERIWDHFVGAEQFDRFCQEQGQPLEQFATYCALSRRFGGDWRRWPVPYRKPNSPAVEEFRRANVREVAYHQWLQWLLDRQLAAASEPLPLVHDIPIAISPSGADAWVWQDLLATGCTIGAPPDAFNTLGQDWVMPPFVPHKLRAAGHEPLVQTIRAAMRHARGVRIDHVMGLFRLYWIPEGFGPQRGAYVRYPHDELLGIVALESHRAGAFVAGEDLGTVEEQTRQKMAEYQVLAFRVLSFERRPPERYPRLAMAAVTTHDLPTIAGLWTGEDEAARRAIGLPKNDAIFEVRKHFAELVGVSDGTPIEQVIEAAHRLLSRSPSLVLLATLEDAMACVERPNMPGTTEQWPNWSLGLPGGLEALQTAELPRRIAQTLRR